MSLREQKRNDRALVGEYRYSPSSNFERLRNIQIISGHDELKFSHHICGPSFSCKKSL